jgi:hypothetical protein
VADGEYCGVHLVRIQWLMVNNCGGHSDVQLAVTVACLYVVADNWCTTDVQLVYNWYKTGIKLGDTVADGEYCGGQIGDMVTCHGYCGVQLVEYSG